MMKDDVQLIKNLFGKKKSKPAARLSEPAQPAKPALTPQAWLLELFKRHGLASTVHDDWVLPGGEKLSTFAQRRVFHELGKIGLSHGGINGDAHGLASTFPLLFEQV